VTGVQKCALPIYGIECRNDLHEMVDGSTINIIFMQKVIPVSFINNLKFLSGGKHYDIGVCVILKSPSNTKLVK